MVEQSMSPSGGYDPEDLSRDRYDLISDDLERHILEHPGREGLACLQLLYKLYDQWTGYLLYEAHNKARHGTKGAETNERRKRAALKWYLAEGEEILKKRTYRSYVELSVKLHMNALNNKKGRPHLKASSTIADVLRDAAKTWYSTKAKQIVRQDPRISVDALVDTLKVMAEQESRVFSLSRKCDIKIYLNNPLELWRVIALSGAPDQPELTQRL